MSRGTRALRHHAGGFLAGLWMAALATGLATPGVSAGTLLVVNKASDTVSLLDAETGRVLKTLPTGSHPHEVAISPDGRWALVSNYGTDDDPGWTLTVIDVENAREDGLIDLAPHTRPHGVTWHPDGQRALVTTEGSDSMLIVDVRERRILMEMATQGDGSHMVTIDPTGRRAYVASTQSGSVTGFDLERQERLGVTVTGVGAEGIAVRPDGEQVWVANRGAGTVSVLRGDDLSTLTTLRAEWSPARVGFTPDSRVALVTNTVSGSISVFDARSLEHVRDFSTRAGFGIQEGRLLGGLFGFMPMPIGMLISEDGDSVYVANTYAGRIGRYRISDGERIEVLKSGEQPDGLGYSRITPAQDVALP